ncbi:hypothetical protein [Trinickia diaoshuihuensis]|uniref:hypothetical protein n=1 Tax=Trinickia diaoshuihuensis TaxID=2292265 RepID=UPI0013C361CF|nr:hypothetical protein [Trinickia diaoshuihuensis]
MGIGFTWRCVAGFAACLCIAGMTYGQKRDDDLGRVAMSKQAQGLTQPQRKDDRIESLGGEPEALLGGPAPAGDLYGNEGYKTQTLGPTLADAKRMRPGTANTQATGNAKGNTADPGSQSPTQSALSIYHGSGDVGKAVGQVYRMPW